MRVRSGTEEFSWGNGGFVSGVGADAGSFGPTNASTGTGFPVINYESIGIRTDLTMREGSIVIAGTLNVGPSGDAIVVVVSARRAN